MTRKTTTVILTAVKVVDQNCKVVVEAANQAFTNSFVLTLAMIMFVFCLHLCPQVAKRTITAALNY